MIFPYPPQKGMVESLEWLTDVIEAYAGSEQRIQLRSVPRVGFECRYHSLSSRAKNLIAANHAGEFDLPLWQDAAPVVVAPGATSIAVDTRYSSYDDSVLLWANEFTNEVVEVASKTDSSLVLATAVTGNYPLGSYAMPAVKARVLDTVGIDDRTKEFNQPRIVWRVMTNV